MTTPDEIKTEILKINPGKDDIVVLKFKNRATEDELGRIKDATEKIFDPVKVIILEPGIDIELIPATNRHYGLWLERKVWHINHQTGFPFVTSCLGAARSLAKYYDGGKVCVFNDDGTPGEVV